MSGSTCSRFDISRSCRLSIRNSFCGLCRAQRRLLGLFHKVQLRQGFGVLFPECRHDDLHVQFFPARRKGHPGFGQRRARARDEFAPVARRGMCASIRCRKGLGRAGASFRVCTATASFAPFQGCAGGRRGASPFQQARSISTKRSVHSAAPVRKMAIASPLLHSIYANV